MSLRPITEADLDFLYELYASTRAEEMALVPWSDGEQEGLLRMQFSAQPTEYQKQPAGAEFRPVLFGG